MFFWKISKKTFLIFLFLLKRSFQKYLIVSKFLLEVPKFKEKVITSIITVTKVRDLLLTFANNNNICGKVSKLNEHRFLILINTSYMILLVIYYELSCLDYFHFARYNSFSFVVCVVLEAVHMEASWSG